MNLWSQNNDKHDHGLKLSKMKDDKKKLGCIRNENNKLCKQNKMKLSLILMKHIFLTHSVKASWYHHVIVNQIRTEWALWLWGVYRDSAHCSCRVFLCSLNFKGQFSSRADANFWPAVLLLEQWNVLMVLGVIYWWVNGQWDGLFDSFVLWWTSTTNKWAFSFIHIRSSSYFNSG